MYSVVYITKENPLMTVGDAVASFIDHRDPVTVKMGLLSIRNVKKNGYSAGVTAWSNRRQRWKDVTSKRRRTVAIITYRFQQILLVNATNMCPDSPSPLVPLPD